MSDKPKVRFGPAGTRDLSTEIHSPKRRPQVYEGYDEDDELELLLARKEFFRKYFKCNTESFNWKERSKDLCEKYAHFFETWWDPDKFNPEHYEYLEKFCFRTRHIWEIDIQ